MNFVQKYTNIRVDKCTNKGVYLYQQQNIINFLKEVFLMRITRKQLETKVNNYNSISDIKLELSRKELENNTHNRIQKDIIKGCNFIGYTLFFICFIDNFYCYNILLV